jgi:hypothetical protein
MAAWRGASGHGLLCLCINPFLGKGFAMMQSFAENDTTSYPKTQRCNKFEIRVALTGVELSKLILPSVYFGFLFNLLFDLEDGGDIFLRNVELSLN